MNYTIAIQCHNFEKRLSWMLSSILQQNNVDKKDIIIDVAYMHDNHICDKLLDHFDNLLNITRTRFFDIKKYQYRSNTRNRQLLGCSTKWLLFADSDHVYHRDYFNRLTKHINDNNLHTYDGMLIAGRYSCNEKMASNMIDSFRYPVTIYDSFNAAKTILEKTLIKKSNVGAGYFQLINTKHCPHENVYVNPDKTKDNGWIDTIQKARSDIQFRRKIGKKQKLPRWFSCNQLHINHIRDNEIGVHSEESR